MSWASAIFLMVLIWGGVTVWSRRHDRELGVTRDEDGNPVFAPPPKADTSVKDAEIAELKERIAVLERIATDNNSADARERARITSEIEALRGTSASALPKDDSVADEPAKDRSARGTSASTDA
ncbi:MAG: hypothetical protein AAF291_17170 [Pseudomonadota bacterium]